MSLKIGIVSAIVIVLFAVLCFLSPGFYILVASLISGIKNEMTSQKMMIGTGQKLKYKKKVTSYNDWNTGQDRQRVDYTLYFKGSALDFNDLKKVIDKKDPQAVENPTIYGAVEMQADDILVALSKDGQGVSYVIARFYTDKASDDLQVELVRTDSEYNWFPDSRIEGWSRIVSTAGEQFLVRHAPFKVVSVGFGDLAKVDFPYAFMAGSDRKNETIFFHQVDLNTGATVADLTLKNDCFVLPRFSFDHPLLDADDSTEDDNDVKFLYGPKWWNKTIEAYSGSDKKLKLASTHELQAAPLKVISIVNPPKTEKIEPPTTPVNSNEPQVENATAFGIGDEELDRISLITNQCIKENPAGFAKAQKASRAVSTMTAAEFCLVPGWNVNAEIRNKVCGPVTRKKLFTKNKVVLSESTFTYTPSNGGKPFSVVTPEMQINGNSVMYFNSPRSKENVIIKESAILNPNQILFKARVDGPWEVFVGTATDTDVAVGYLGEYGYPGSETEETEDHDFYYIRSSSILIRKDPVGYLDRLQGLLGTKSKNAAAFYLDEEAKELNLRTVSFTKNQSMEPQELWSAQVATECFAGDLPSAQMTLAQREQWLKKYFNWSANSDQLILRQGLGSSKKNCTLRTVK